MANKSNPKKIRFHVGGPDFHPVADQAGLVAQWLGGGFECSLHHDKEIFNHLEECDLVVMMGLFYSSAEKYTPLTRQHEEAFTRYVASGRPLLLHHGAVASYDDSETFKRLVGINWVWGGDRPTQHSPLGDYTVTVRRPEHPLLQDVSDYILHDELYYDLHTNADIKPEVLAHANYEGQQLPMVQCFSGGRVGGAGRAVYLANGHDLRAFECPAMRKLWLNAVHWLTKTSQQP